jgi:hypothetical protein
MESKMNRSKPTRGRGWGYELNKKRSIREDPCKSASKVLGV